MGWRVCGREVRCSEHKQCKDYGYTFVSGIFIPISAISNLHHLKNIFLYTVHICDWLWDIFAHIFKIELLPPQGRVSSQL